MLQGQTSALRLSGVYLLKTAVALIINPNNDAKENVLFDEGSQQSFLLQATAQKLELQPQKEENIQLLTFGSQEPQTQTIGKAHISFQTAFGKTLPLMY